MIRVIKYFTFIKDVHTSYEVGTELDFGKEKNQRLVDKGYAEFIKVEVKEQKAPRKTKELKAKKDTK